MKPFGKGSQIPPESAECLKFLLLIASPQLLGGYRNRFVRGTEKQEDSYIHYPSLSEKKIYQERIDNTGRKHSAAFKYPGNGHFYMVLKSDACGKFVYSLKEASHDCYVFQSASIKNLFKVSQEDKSLWIF